MKLLKTIWLLLLPIVLFSCSQDESESDNFAAIKFDKNSVLKINNCLDIAETEYSLCFESVDDSRCPTNAVCVWEGNAAANFVLKSTTGNTPFTLNTNESFKRDTILNNLKIELIGVLPYPILNKTTNPNEYVVEIKISKQS